MCETPAVPTYTDLMAHKLYMDELNQFLQQREKELAGKLGDANEACLQLAKEVDQLQAEVNRLNKIIMGMGQEIRALKRQLLN